MTTLNQSPPHYAIAELLAGKIAPGQAVTVKGWIRTRRDSKAGLSFLQLHDGSSFAPLQIVAPNTLANYDAEVLHLSMSSGRPSSRRMFFIILR